MNLRLGHFSFVACFRVLALLRGIMPLDLIGKKHNCDKDILLDAAETILGILVLIVQFMEIGFERKIESGGTSLERNVEKT
jgi:hypothetical protein